jgi:hypothetical protein
MKLELVGPVGLEPTTSRLEGACSIQLSYGPEILAATDRETTVLAELYSEIALQANVLNDQNKAVEALTPCLEGRSETVCH